MNEFEERATASYNKFVKDKYEVEHDIQLRAIKIYSKLGIGQRVMIDQLSKSLNNDTNKSIHVENLYDKMVGILLEPAIAREWISNGCRFNSSYSGKVILYYPLEDK